MHGKRDRRQKLSLIAKENTLINYTNIMLVWYSALVEFWGLRVRGKRRGRGEGGGTSLTFSSP